MMFNGSVTPLQKFEKLLKPGFIRPGMLKASSSLDGGGAAAAESPHVKYRGAMFSLKRDQELEVAEAMTPVYFNSLKLTVFRGYDYAIEGLL